MGSSIIIKRPLVLTEKARFISEKLNQYVFEVEKSANKIEIGKAIQDMFKVNVVSVRTMVVRGKMRRMGRGYAKLPNWKKAIVTLKAGDKIGFFEANPEGNQTNQEGDVGEAAKAASDTATETKASE